MYLSDHTFAAKHSTLGAAKLFVSLLPHRIGLAAIQHCRTACAFRCPSLNSDVRSAILHTNRRQRVAILTGLEPATSCVTGKRTLQTVLQDQN